MKNKKITGSLMLLLASIFWGLSYSFQGLASEMGSYGIVFFKSVGGILLFIVGLIKKEKINKEALIGGSIIGVICFIGCFLQQKAVELSSAANASFITSLYIVEVPIIGLLLGKKAPKKIWFSAGLALVGMYLLCVKAGFKINIGDIYCLIGSLCFALQIILIDLYINQVEVFTFTGLQQIVTASLALIMMLLKEKTTMNVIINYLPILLYLSLIAGAIAQLLQNRFQRDIEPNLASLLMALESVFGALFGWLILKQVLGLKEIIGCFIIFVAILLAELKND